jgi:hypothetical protein
LAGSLTKQNNELGDYEKLSATSEAFWCTLP